MKARHKIYFQPDLFRYNSILIMVRIYCNISGCNTGLTHFTYSSSAIPISSYSSFAFFAFLLLTNITFSTSHPSFSFSLVILTTPLIDHLNFRSFSAFLFFSALQCIDLITKSNSWWLSGVPWDQLKWIGLTNCVAIYQFTIVFFDYEQGKMWNTKKGQISYLIHFTSQFHRVNKTKSIFLWSHLLLCYYVDQNQQQK